ncbi:MAG: arylsulfatase [Pedosphaera sp.]|nr:arylsulfatase [Pedosphaera sp.]
MIPISLRIGFFILLSWSALAASASRKPNILVILSDDMGFSDIGCYGGEISTPHLDGLARDGLRFTQFYNTARCCPTRASLLTGLHPHQAGVGHMMEERPFVGYRGQLGRNAVTIAEALKGVGYRSYAVGKWHVTPGESAKALLSTNNWPLQRGFDRFYGTIHGAGSFWDPSSLVRDNRQITIANDPEYRPSSFYYTDAIAEQATRFIREHGRESNERPFFLYVAFTAAHWPIHARESDIVRQSGRYAVGYKGIHQARWEKQKRLGIVDSSWLPAPMAAEWNSVNNRPFEERCMEVYAAMVESMDQGIGRILGALKAGGQSDNTVVLYLQDNGGCAEGIGRGSQPSGSTSSTPMNAETPQYGSQPKQTRDGRSVRQGYGVMPGADDTYVAYGRAWAAVSNTPFREYKHWVHEGGISTPLIIRWPIGIRAKDRNGLISAPGQLPDILATCIDLAGAQYPLEYEGNRITPLEGTSLRPLLEGRRFRRVNPLVWEHEGNRAIRQGQWKLVTKGEKVSWELYNLSIDRTESHDLAGVHPDKVRTLTLEWEKWARRAKVLPGPWN